jgi:NAD(P)H-hydrate repair Nnr-like enzyme with NAD(P)H-hydrate dehydratase domain
LVLKGNPSRVWRADGRAYENTSGGPALATAGSGDVLAGIIAGIIAQGIEPAPAAEAAVYLHGLAGDLVAATNTVAGVIASDVIEAIPTALLTIKNKFTES